MLRDALKALPIIGPAFLAARNLGRAALRPALGQRERRARRAMDELRSHGVQPLFYVISLETLTTCNNTCAFCAANRLIDTRGRNSMPFEVITKVLDQLNAVGYCGVVNLNINNEPLLDDRLPDIVAYARKALPSAVLTLWTNGLLLNWDCHAKLFATGLNALHINNYANNGKVHTNVARFLREFKNSEFARSGLCSARLFMRRLDELGDNRGGTAPNKMTPRHRKPLAVPCQIPSMEAHVNFRGDLFLCCVDVRYSTPMGTVGSQSVTELWQGDTYSHVREALNRGKRAGIRPCETCDKVIAMRKVRVKLTATGSPVYIYPSGLRAFASRKLVRQYASGSISLSNFATRQRRAPRPPDGRC